MKCFLFLKSMVFLLVFGFGSGPLCYGQDVTDPNDMQEILRMGRILRLFDFASSQANSITFDEIRNSSRSFRYEGFIQSYPDFGLTYLPLDAIAEQLNMRNMLRLELLKYLLDTGYVPFPPYVTAEYFRTNEEGSNEIFPTREAIRSLQIACADTFLFPCDSSPVSFMKVGILSTLLLKESGQESDDLPFPQLPRASEKRTLSYTDLEGLFSNLGYTGEDFNQQDLRELARFFKDLHYVPLWPDQTGSKPYIKDVTDDTFERDVLDAKGPVLLYFHASWCPPCRTTDPLMEELALEFKGDFTLARVFITGNPEIRNQVFINEEGQRVDGFNIPVFVFFNDGVKQTESELYGLPNRELEVFEKAIEERLQRNQETNRTDTLYYQGLQALRYEGLKEAFRSYINEQLSLIQ